MPILVLVPVRGLISLDSHFHGNDFEHLTCQKYVAIPAQAGIQILVCFTKDFPFTAIDWIPIFMGMVLNTQHVKSRFAIPSCG
jgi:hypothetical protein